MTCPDPIELEAYLAGALDADDRARIEAHLAGCSACRDSTGEVSENLNLIARVKELLPRAATRPGHPERVGPFRILRDIGHGGMGVVYLAEQDHPKRRVALKVVRPGLASPGVLRRFEREADALARLEHPNIARIFETGVARVEDTSGWSEPRPWFAMEFSSGEPLDVWVRDRHPSFRKRLGVLADVADAIHHAHLNGVVHRDLKPANILVERMEGSEDVRPKVLDFGIARLTDSELATRSLQTEIGKVLGTIPFMSPEQVVGDPARINAKSDIYSLGVLGYWLLSGELPYAVRDRSLPEAARIIRDEEPRTLSATGIALGGDVQTILGKCLEKDPSRRYASAAAVAEDVRRFLSDEPILARPPSTSYALRKFVRRNRVLVGAVVVVLLVSVAAAITGTSLALRARRAAAEAGRNLDQAEAMNAFLVGMLSSANPEFEGSRETTVREVLDNAAKELEAGRLDDHPATEASIRRVLGNTYGILGRYEAGEAQLRTALDLAERPDTDIDPFNYLTDLGLLIKDVKKHAEAESLFLRSLDLARQAGQGSREAVALSNAAAAALDQGAFARGESLLLRSTQSEDVSEPLRVTNLNNVGVLRYRRGDYAAAEETLRRALIESREVYGPEHPSTLSTLGNLGRAVLETGSTAEAESLFREALAGTRRVFGDVHVRTAIGLELVAGALDRQGRVEEARPLYEEALATYEGTVGAGDPRVASVRKRIVDPER